MNENTIASIQLHFLMKGYKELEVEYAGGCNVRLIWRGYNQGSGSSESLLTMLEACKCEQDAHVIAIRWWNLVVESRVAR